MDQNKSKRQSWTPQKPSKTKIQVGKVKIAEEKDFITFKNLVDTHDGWELEYETKNDTTKVWTKVTTESSFKMIKVHAVLQNISQTTLFDVLHDPEYRKEWDKHMLVSIDIGYLNPNNDVGYYAISCPSPIKNRDFVLQRSWKDAGDEKIIFNHSINHKDFAPKKEFVRATSFLTGYVIRKRENGCFLGYITQTDPKGKLPSCLVNRISQFLAPKLVNQLKTAAEGYDKWKSQQRNPKNKPWIFPELVSRFPKVAVSDCNTQYVPSAGSSNMDQKSKAHTSNWIF